MKTIGCAAVAALMLGLTACDQASTARGAGTAAVTFEARPDLAENVQALPRLVGGGAAVKAINADLELRDAAVRSADCDEGPIGLERSVSQPMTGPGFISFGIVEGFYCPGTPHPSIDEIAITYDLATGRQVDWVAAAPGLELTRADTTDMPADYVPGLSSTALSAWYSANAPILTGRGEDCADVWTPEALEGNNFRLWLDAGSGGLSVAPSTAYVGLACAETATMNLAEMRRFRVSPAMIEAVTTAHGPGPGAGKGG